MNIVIVGLGVIGGSYAKALKNAGYDNVFGIDKNPETLEKAKELGLIKEGFQDGSICIKNADLIIISIYPRLVRGFIEENKNNFKDGAVITDATGIKEMFINEVVDALPENVDFVFGHPMAGREKKGIDFSSAEVFKGANYLITVIERNKEENIKLIEKMAAEMGFKRIRRITPKFHDEMISFTSQLPHALAVALINADVEGRDTGSFIGDSYRDLTRIANINEDLWSELFLGNKNNLIKSIIMFEDELMKIKTALIHDDKEKLKALFKESTRRREKL